MAVYFSPTAQIKLLKANKSFTSVSIEYFDNIDSFSFELTTKLPEYSGINNYAIELKDDN